MRPGRLAESVAILIARLQVSGLLSLTVAGAVNLEKA